MNFALCAQRTSNFLFSSSGADREKVDEQTAIQILSLSLIFHFCLREQKQRLKAKERFDPVLLVAAAAQGE